MSLKSINKRINELSKTRTKVLSDKEYMEIEQELEILLEARYEIEGEMRYNQ